MKTCPDCGSRVYSLGCTWCNEEAYIKEQAHFDAINDSLREKEDANDDRHHKAVGLHKLQPP